MDNLLASAEVRKRDFLLAQEKKFKKERETEGDEFAGKEKFVTNAYKRQQEEARKAEEEERLREGMISHGIVLILEKARKKGQGMASFYRNLLEEEESKHDAAVSAASKAKGDGKVTNLSEPAVELPREKKLAEEAKEINAKLGTEAVLLNDDGEVVDKRQLLKGGLNVRPKEETEVQTAKSDYRTEYNARREAQRDREKERQTRQRQQKVIQEQYLMTKKRAADEEAEREEEIRLRAKTKKTTDDVMSARERYLARKKAATQGI
jgi:coiled-coil domain-containing protein 55